MFKNIPNIFTVLLLDVPLIHICEYVQCKLFFFGLFICYITITQVIKKKKKSTLFPTNVSLERQTIIISNSAHIVVYIQRIYTLVMFLLDVLTYLAWMLSSVLKEFLYFDVLMVAVGDFTTEFTENNDPAVNSLIIPSRGRAA